MSEVPNSEELLEAEAILIGTLDENDPKEIRDTAYLESLMDPTMFPKVSKYNIDRECDLVSMWKSEEDMEVFHSILQQSCHLKNNCSISPDALPFNVTLNKTSITRDDFVEMGVNMTDYDLDLLNSTQNGTDLFYKIDPNGIWAIKKVKMSNLISDKCYERIFD
jgi:hypothetical protein